MGRIYAVVNQKGGVGKTTTSLNLAAYLAQAGRDVLLVDLDPQANATSGLGVDREAVAAGTYDVLAGETPAANCVVATPVERLALMPSSTGLAGAEVELVSAERREYRLREALSPVADRYAAILVDAPPSLGLLTLNALAAADGALVPVQCEYYALEGVGALMNTCRLVRSHLNPALRLAGVILTMYDPRTNLAQQVAEEVRRHFSSQVFETVVPRSVRLSEAPSHGQTIMQYDPKSRGAEAYAALAAELIRREGL